jgi:biotin carboxyl carrier protein
MGPLMAPRTLTVRVGDRTHQVRVENDGVVAVSNEQFRVTPGPQPGELIVSSGAAIARVFVAMVNGTRWVFHNGEAFEASVDTGNGLRRRPRHQGSLTAPMPATVVSVHAKPGDHVTTGTTLIVLEAMKMELPVRAPSDGTVTAVNCKPGELVQPGVPLIEVQ